ncbi:MAG: hypothetical protein KDA99_17840, partial [Planctomycetales bacterium]|nr:hypothetical protein [Planctomycetales bacterium]
DVWMGRTTSDAPDVDGVVWVTGSDLTIGEIVPCEIVAMNGYDLAAAPLEPEVSGKKDGKRTRKRGRAR